MCWVAPDHIEAVRVSLRLSRDRTGLHRLNLTQQLASGGFTIDDF